MIDRLHRVDARRLVTGEDKKAPLAKLLAGDRSIPAGWSRPRHSLVFADPAAA